MRELESQATPLPWNQAGLFSRMLTGFGLTAADADFIIAAVNSLPGILEALEGALKSKALVQPTEDASRICERCGCPTPVYRWDWDLCSNCSLPINGPAALTASIGDSEASDQAQIKALRLDKQRLDWLEGEYRREQEAFAQGAIPGPSLFRGNRCITREAIDQAAGLTGGEGNG